MSKHILDLKLFIYFTTAMVFG